MSDEKSDLGDSAARLKELTRIYEQVDDHMECCKCADCTRFRMLAAQVDKRYA